VQAVSTSMLAAQALGRRIGDAWVWRDLNPAIWPGERIALAGPTGSGKSLLLRALVGLDPVDAGRVLVAGRTPEPGDWPRVRAEYIYLPQQVRLREATVAGALARPFQLAVHRGKRLDREAAVAWFARCGRGADFLDKRTDYLSGGEAQLVQLVRALLLAPRMLLLDEPTAAMDANTAAQAEACIAVWHTPQRAYIWTSHDEAQLARVCDRRIVLSGMEDRV